MSQHKNSDPKIPNTPLVLPHPLRKSSLDVETSCTETNGGEPPTPPRNRPPTSGMFWLNDGDEPLIVDSRRRNGLILYKRYHAEFAGPGSAVGGVLDRDCQNVLPVGNFSLVCPESSDERQRAYLIRRQWIRLTGQIINNPSASRRAQMLLNQFENFFNAETIAQLPDEALALLIGVLPQTIRIARSNYKNSD